MNNPKITPEEIGIIKKAQTGKESAFNKLYHMYKDFVVNLLYQYVKDIDEAKDLSNVVFLKVHNKLEKFTNYSSFGGWLRILTKNTAVDYLRTIKEKTISIDDQYNSIQLSNVENIEDKQCSTAYDKLIELIEDLPDITKKAVSLYYIDGMTVSQISKAINVPTGTIKSYLYRIRKNLKKQLKLC